MGITDGLSYLLKFSASASRILLKHHIRAHIAITYIFSYCFLSAVLYPCFLWQFNLREITESFLSRQRINFTHVINLTHF